jgi:hypothetical protein
MERQRDGGAPRAVWRTWLAIAFEGSVVRRALKFSLVVGSILGAINHGDEIVAGAIDGRRLAKLVVTYLVPYTVSTLSSVGATLRARGERSD